VDLTDKMVLGAMVDKELLWAESVKENLDRSTEKTVLLAMDRERLRAAIRCYYYFLKDLEKGANANREKASN